MNMITTPSPLNIGEGQISLVSFRLGGWFILDAYQSSNGARSHSTDGWLLAHNFELSGIYILLDIRLGACEQKWYSFLFTTRSSRYSCCIQLEEHEHEARHLQGGP